MKQDEADQFHKTIMAAIGDADVHTLLGVIATGLIRIAAAQEEMVELAVQDLNEQVEEVVKARAEELAQEMDEEKTKRSYIGRR